MFGISLGKLVVLALVLAAVWFGFKFVSRARQVRDGNRKPGERSFAERLRRSAREKGNGESTSIEETEKCPTCGVFVSVEVGGHCGKSACPY